MLIDSVEIEVTGGHGGPGKVSFSNLHGADGGNGGHGGSVYAEVTSDLKALNQFSSTKFIKAPDGLAGGSNRLSGKAGLDLTLVLPIGTTILDLEIGETTDLVSLDQRILLAKGGLGGRGNLEFKSSTNRSPKHAQPGLPGTHKSLKLDLKFIAQYGLIGLPNAGKSSLLNELTNAKAQVGAYPFTTLEANLGTIGPKVIADIPGLIEGASSGKGLGTKFLKHIEKVSILLHCISSDSSDPIADYNTVLKELELFDPIMLDKQQVILVTKTDLVGPDQLADLVAKLKPLNRETFLVSIHDLDSIVRLKKFLSQIS